MVLLYVDKQREKLGNHGQATLLILDAFRGQMTQEVTTLLRENNIFWSLFKTIRLFQPLYLIVNDHCKSFIEKITERFAQETDNQFTLGKKWKRSR